MSALLVQICELHIQVHYCMKNVQQQQENKDQQKRDNRTAVCQFIMTF